MYESVRATITKYHMLAGWFKQKLIFLQFWMPKVQRQDVSRICFLLRPFIVACRWLPYYLCSFLMYFLTRTPVLLDPYLYDFI